MPLPLDPRCIAAAESKLGTAFPPAYRSWMTACNGGVVEIADEPWVLHPILDDSSADRTRRTWDDVVRQTGIARTWRGFPKAAVSIAGNDDGDRLVLLSPNDGDAPPALGRWDHEIGTVEWIAGGVEAVFAAP